MTVIAAAAPPSYSAGRCAAMDAGVLSRRNPPTGRPAVVAELPSAVGAAVGRDRGHRMAVPLSV